MSRQIARATHPREPKASCRSPRRSAGPRLVRPAACHKRPIAPHVTPIRSLHSTSTPYITSKISPSSHTSTRPSLQPHLASTTSHSLNMRPRHTRVFSSGIFTTTTAARFSNSSFDDDQQQPSDNTVQLNILPSTHATSNSNIDPLLGTTINKLFTKKFSATKKAAKKPTMDPVLESGYNQYIDMNDQGDGLAWAGNPESTLPPPDNDADAAAAGGAQPKRLHEQIIQLYLDHYNDNEDSERMSNLSSTHRDELDKNREQFIHTLVHVLSPKAYSRFVHHFRLCLHRLRQVMIKYEESKQYMRDNNEQYLDVDIATDILKKQLNSTVQDIKTRFFRQSARTFAEQSDVFMPQLVMYLGTMTLAELEAARDRQTTSKMNTYSCGFWDPASATDFIHQFQDSLPQDVPLIAQTFNVSRANRLYASLDIHIDNSTPLFWNKMKSVQERSHKVFVRNIPSQLTTRELMTLFGNCGVLLAAEIYRSRPLDDASSSSAMLNGGQHMNGNDSNVIAQQNSSFISKKEALIQANAAALTVDLADISLTHFTTSFKTDQLLVPSHIIDGQRLRETIEKNISDNMSRVAALTSAKSPLGIPNDSDSEDDSYNTQKQPNELENPFNQEQMDQEWARFEKRHFKRAQRQQQKANSAAAAENGSDSVDVAVVNDTNTPKNNLMDDQLNSFNFRLQQRSPVQDKMNINSHYSPVHGFLYFATKEGKARALKRSLQIFGVSTANGYAMTTMDSAEKRAIIVTGFQRNLSHSEVDHLIRAHLAKHMPIERPLAPNDLDSTGSPATDSSKSNVLTTDPSVVMTSIIQSVYVPRAYTPGVRRQDAFNTNRGHAIVTFHSHEHAIEAFRYLNKQVVEMVPSVTSPTSGVHDINEEYNAAQIDADLDALASVSSTSEMSTNASRILQVFWKRDESNRHRRQRQHPITLYFPTFARPKQRLDQIVSQQLKDALHGEEAAAAAAQEEEQQSKQ